MGKWTNLDDDELRDDLGLAERPLILLKDDEFPDVHEQILSLAAAASGLTDYFSQIKKGISVHFAPTSSLEINGRAVAAGVARSRRFATITVGAILYLHNFFFYIMSRPDILPKIGKPDKEKNRPDQFDPPQTHPFLKPLFDRGRFTEQNSTLPNCEIRREFAETMFSAACEFMLMHEIAHCVNGHVRSASLSATELNSFTNENPHFVLRMHTLEMDADSWALKNLLTAAEEDTKKNPDFLWSPSMTAFRGRKLLYPALVSIYLLFRLFDSPRAPGLTASAMLTGTHPHPATRTYLAGVTLSTAGITLGIDSVDQQWVPKLSLEATLDSESIWRDLTGAQNLLGLSEYIMFCKNSRVDEIALYQDHLSKCWDVMREDLLKHALAPLAPSAGNFDIQLDDEIARHAAEFQNSINITEKKWRAAS